MQMKKTPFETFLCLTLALLELDIEMGPAIQLLVGEKKLNIQEFENSYFANILGEKKTFFLLST